MLISIPMRRVKWPEPSGIRRTRLIPRCLPHWYMTKASFTEMHITSSTPCERSSSYISSNEGHCSLEQVGVKAPGSENTTTRRPSNSSRLLTSCQRNGLSPPMLSSRTRVLNTTSGM